MSKNCDSPFALKKSVKIKSDEFYIIKIAGGEIVGVKLVYENVVCRNAEQVA